MAAASSSRPLPMASLSHSHSLSRLRLSPAYARFSTTTTLPSPSPSPSPFSSSCASSHTRFSTAAAVPCAPRVRVRVSSPTDSAALNATWLASLSSPLPRKDELGLDSGEREGGNGCKPEWIIGVDPDVSGALALLRPDGSGSPSGYSAQVFDSPFVKVMVGKSLRKRLDPRSMVELLHSFNAPIGTTAYIEQSTPFPQDGKQGWWSGGFGYGMWLGVLVASGFSVKPISSVSWKNFFELSRSSSTKDDSRRVASDMFPSLAPELKRKKDHGRAEALLIAAYGRSLTQQSNENYSLTEAKELQVQLC